MTDLELPGMEDLPRLPPKPKARYRVDVSVEITYRDQYEYVPTEGWHPGSWLDQEHVASAAESDAITLGDAESGWLNWGTIEASYDDGLTWEVWDEQAWERDREEDTSW